jgi:hypothetical protein
MLLNKLPCLDKGYVAFLDSSCNSDKLKDVAMELFKKTDYKNLHDLTSLTLVVKCPMFIQMNLWQNQLKCIKVPTTDMEAYCPNVGEIGSPDHDTNKAIMEDIKKTTDALLVNTKAYQADGANRFVSQVLTPISTYTTVIVQGSYNEWMKFCSQPNMPAPFLSYVVAIKQILTTEWK